MTSPFSERPPEAIQARLDAVQRQAFEADRFCEETVTALEQQLATALHGVPPELELPMAVGILARFCGRGLLAISTSCHDVAARDHLYRLVTKLVPMLRERVLADLRQLAPSTPAAAGDSFASWAAGALSGLFRDASEALHGKITLATTLPPIGDRRIVLR